MSKFNLFHGEDISGNEHSAPTNDQIKVIGYSFRSVFNLVNKLGSACRIIASNHLRQRAFINGFYIVDIGGRLFINVSLFEASADEKSFFIGSDIMESLEAMQISLADLMPQGNFTDDDILKLPMIHLSSDMSQISNVCSVTPTPDGATEKKIWICLSALQPLK